MPRSHRRERKRRLVVAAATVIVAAACSGSNGGTGAPSTTTQVAATSTTLASVPPTITATPVTGPSGTIGTITTAKGRGPASVALPASVGLPAIVHAQYDGTASFAVRALDAHGNEQAVLATSLGAYNGTFPVGFLAPKGAVTAQLRVETTGPWELDIAKPALAPMLTAPGVSGNGDTVLAYTGTAAAAQVSFLGTTEFRVDTYSEGRVTMLVSARGPYAATIALPAGPAFVSVTAAGKWSITVEAPG